jgi:ankyrin repeat protein
MPPKKLDVATIGLILRTIQNTCMSSQHKHYIKDLSVYSENEFETIIKFLQSNKKLSAEDLNYFLILAATNQKYKQVHILLKFKETEPYHIGDGKTTVLMCAAFFDTQKTLVEKLLPKASADYINLRNEGFGRTAFYTACNEGASKIAMALLQNPLCDPTITANDGTGPLYAACSRGDETLVKALLAKLSDDDIKKSRQDGVTCLLTAIDNRHFHLVPLLLKRIKDSIWVNKTKSGWSNPVEIALARGAGATVIKALVEAGARFSEYYKTNNPEVASLISVLEQEQQSKFLDGSLIKTNHEAFEEKLAKEIALPLSEQVLTKEILLVYFVSLCVASTDVDLKLLLKHPQLEINMSEGLGRTGLELACRVGNLAALKILFSNKKVILTVEALKSIKTKLAQEVEEKKLTLDKGVIDILDKQIRLLTPKKEEETSTQQTFPGNRSVPPVPNAEENFAKRIQLAAIKCDGVKEQSVDSLIGNFKSEFFTQLTSEQKANFIYTVLKVTIHAYHLPLVKQLLTELKAIPAEFKNNFNLSETLIFACQHSDNKDLIETFLEAKKTLGIDVNHILTLDDESRTSAIELDYLYNKNDIVDLLLKHGADPSLIFFKDRQTIDALALEGLEKSDLYPTAPTLKQQLMRADF